MRPTGSYSNRPSQKNVGRLGAEFSADGKVDSWCLYMSAEVETCLQPASGSADGHFEAIN